jgi:radical SAM superfamily enzyme YgiQ (UPF0313 family)
MAAAMRVAGVPLWTLESYEPVATCDLWGFTLPHELTFTNVLEMLDLAGVPPRSAERGEDDPLVLGGGPAVANPWPLAGFFDAFFIGEVEGRLGEIVAALGGATRAERLTRLAAVPGIWIPADAPRPVTRQVFMGFSSQPPVTEPLVPLLEAVHDRVVIEVMRGCTAGCRFCQAGTWYRPVRERPVDMVVESARRALAATGCDEVSLISLSSCDYSGVAEAVARIRALRPGLRVSLPSLRIDSAAMNLARLGSEQRGSVTLAPEAGTQELRDAINKGVDDSQFREAVTASFQAGFTGLKLYFMIGLPGEDDAAVGAIGGLVAWAAGEARRIARGRARVSVAVSSYVPKAHTAFQAEPFAGETTLRHRQQILRAAMPRGVRLAFHDLGASVVEATLARAGRGSDDLVDRAWHLGARFDGWSEHFDLATWRRAAAETGFDLSAATPLTPTGPLPWDSVRSGVSDASLAHEFGRSRTRTPTLDCRRGPCSACGVCHDDVEMDVLA